MHCNCIRACLSGTQSCRRLHIKATTCMQTPGRMWPRCIICTTLCQLGLAMSSLVAFNKVVGLVKLAATSGFVVVAVAMLPCALGYNHAATAGTPLQSSPSPPSAAAAPSFSKSTAILQALAAEPCNASAAAAAAALSLQLASHQVERYQEGLELVMAASRWVSLCNHSEVPSSVSSSSPLSPLLLPLALHRIAAICMFWQGREHRNFRLAQLISHALAEQPPSTGIQPSWLQACRELPADVDLQVHVSRWHCCICARALVA